MGSYSDLRLGTFHIGSIKDDIDPSVMTLYRETDKCIRVVNKSSPELQNSYDIEDLEENEITLVQFKIERFERYVSKSHDEFNCYIQETLQLLK
jgi:hypothetical protein